MDKITGLNSAVNNQLLVKLDSHILHNPVYIEHIIELN